VFFGAKRVGHSEPGNPTIIGGVTQDRVGSLGSYYPYGEDKGTPLPNDQWKFATYTRDSASGLDYAMNRYYSSSWGRFTTPDPMGHANAADPQTWNQYSYVDGDPIGSGDPSGLCTVMIDGVNGNPDQGPFTNTAIQMGADSAYPYSGINKPTGWAASFGDQQAVLTAYNAIEFALLNNSGSIDIVTNSAGATAFSQAYSELTPNEQSRIGNILYLAPGGVGTLQVNSSTTVVHGSGGTDIGASLGLVIPAGQPITDANCAHSDFACLASSPTAAAVLSQMTADGPCNSPNVFTRQSPYGSPGYGVPKGGGGVAGITGGMTLQQTFVPGENGDAASWTVGAWVWWSGPQSPKFYSL